MIPIGTVLGGNRILRELGRGGMGVVYEAFDDVLERRTAVKMMLPEAAAEKNKKRFTREAAAIARCDHPGIINVYSFGEYQGRPYFVMEYVDGRPLDSFLERGRILKNGNIEELKEYGYLPEPQEDEEDAPYFLRNFAASPLENEEHGHRAAALVANAADALFEAHSLGILHRDIKPSNLLLTSAGAVKLADFGLAKSVSSPSLTRDHQLLGTLKYMPPETFSDRESTPASDIYSLGVVFYELLTLAHPFSTENTAAFIKAVTQDPCPPPSRLNPRVSPAADEVALKCLSKDPADRYRNARELADALRGAASGRGLGANIFDGIMSIFRQTGSRRTRPAPAAARGDGVSEEDRREALRLAGEARLAYFRDLDLTRGIVSVTEALNLDPACLDAYFMLALISGHMGVHLAVKKAIPRLKELEKAQTDPDLRERIRLLTGFLEGSGDWLRRAERYLRAGGDDIHIAALCARRALASDDYRLARDCADRIKARFPDSGMFDWFVTTYHYSWLGYTDKSIEMTRSAIKAHPELILPRVGLVQELTEAGRLDEAEAEVAAALKVAPADDLLTYFRGQLFLHKRDLPAACGEFRKFIGLTSNESLKSYVYHELYRVCAGRGEAEQARKYLEIARNLAPELDFKTTEELRALVNGLDAVPAAFEGVERAHLEALLADGKEALFESLVSAYNNAAVPTAWYFRLEKARPPRNLHLWFIYNSYNLQGMKTARLFLPALPLSSFNDQAGNILKTEFRKVEAAYGRYLAGIDYAAPLPPNAPCVLGAELDMENAWKEGADGVAEFSLTDTARQPGRRVYMLAVPAGAETLSLSPEPRETKELDGDRLLIYSPYLFDTQVFTLTAKFRFK